jgi:hypothetical protein
MKKSIDDSAVPGAPLSIDEISYPVLIQTYPDLVPHDSCAARTLEIVWDGLEVRPLAVQFPVFNRSMHVATKVDLVARDKRGVGTQTETADRKDNSQLWLIETKCSCNVTMEEYIEARDKNTGCYRGPAHSAVYSLPGVFSGLPASDVVANVMQTLLAGVILARSYDIHPRRLNLLLLKICTDGVVIIQMEEHMKREMLPLYQAMCTYEQQKSKKCKK